MNVNKFLFGFIKIAFSIMILLMIVYAAVRICSLAYDYGYRLYTEPAMEEAPGRDVLVQVKDGMSNRDIADMLQEKDLVRDSSLFFVQITLSGYKNSIQPGLYTLNTSMEPKELIVAMSPDPETEDETETGTEDTGEELFSETEGDYDDFPTEEEP